MTEHAGPGPALPHGPRPTLRVVGGTAAEPAGAEDELLRARAAAARAAHPSSGVGVPGFRRPQPVAAVPDTPQDEPQDERPGDVPAVDGRGPHLVTGPALLAAARPGDVLAVEVLGLRDDGGSGELLEPGCTAYLPVRTDGALFCPRELHRAMGVAVPGAGAGAVHGSFRVTVRPPGAQDVPSVAQRQPLAETDEHWIVVGRSAGASDDERTFCMTTAVHRAVSAGVAFLQRDRGVDEPIAHAYLSATAEFAVTRHEDGTVGAHGRIRKADFR